MPLISVLLPSYNHEKFIEKAITSVLNQTHQNLELIITDDCSTDSSVEIIRKFSDPRISFLKQEINLGPSAAYNHSYLLAKGKYIAPMSSDDVWDSRKLEKQIHYLDNNIGIGVVFSNVSFIDENDQIITSNIKHLSKIFCTENRSKEEWLNRFFYRGNCLCHPSALIRKECHDEVGLLDNRLLNLHDYDFWIRFCLRYEMHILENKLVEYRLRSDNANLSSVSLKTLSRADFETKQIFNQFLKITDADLFAKIFPSAKVYGIVEDSSILYFLSMLAFECSDIGKKQWGLEILHLYLGENGNADYLQKNYNFKYGDFFKLTAQNEITITSKMLRGFFRGDKNRNRELLKNIHMQLSKAIKNIFK